MAVTGAALVIAAGLVGWTSLSVAVAQERSVRLRLDELLPRDRALRVVYYTVAGSSDVHARRVASTVRAFSDLTEGVHQATIWHPVGPEDQRGTSFVVVRNPAADVIVSQGRLPRGECDLTRCEALALSGRLQPGQTVRVGPETLHPQIGPVVRVPAVKVEIVGVGAIKAVAFPAGSRLGMRQLLVGRLGDPMAGVARLYSGMTSVTTAPLDPTKVRASRLGKDISRLRQAVVSLDRSDPENLVQASAPNDVLNSIEQRGAVARDRLLVISGQAAALVIAFAAFVASTRRRELRLLERQLIDLGANRFQAWSTGALEVVLPGIAAALLVFGGLVVAALARAPSQESGFGFVSAALPPSTVLTVAAVLVVAVGLLAFSGSRQATRRLGLGPLEAAAVVAFGVIVWQAVSTKDLSATRIAASGRGPVLLLLPALTFFVSAVILVRLLPLLVRIAERYSRSGPVGVRLAFLGAARRPAQAAVATTFLAVAVGAAAFSLDYRASLEQQARDEANFAAGALWRVIEARPQQRLIIKGRGPIVQPVSTQNDVAPLTRYASVSKEQPTPVLRLPVQQLDVSTGANQAGVHMTLLAVPASELPNIRGWRANFAAGSRDKLARLLQPRPIAFGGPAIGRRATELRVWVKGTGHPTNVVLWFQLPGQDTRTVALGPTVPLARWTLLRYPLPAELRGSQLVGIDLDPVADQFGPLGFGGQDWLGPVQQKQAGTWSNVDPLTGWTTVADAFNVHGIISVVPIKGGPVRSAIHFIRAGTALSLLRRQLHLPAAIPVLASPSVAASASEGLATFTYGGSPPIPIRIVGTTKLFPTITSRSRFIVADYGTAFAVLNTVFPGIAPPTEAWFFDQKTPAFSSRLARAPFRLTRLISEQQQEQTLLSDPLASGTRGLLLATGLVSALLGLFGLLVAIRASLRDESSILAEYEALGIRPSVLARSTALRLAALSLIGIVAGLGGGLLAVRLIGSLVAVTAGGGIPIPPIQTIVAWPGVLALLAVVGVAGVVSAFILARRAFVRPVAERLRA